MSIKILTTILEQALKYALLTCGVVLIIYFGIVERIIADMLTHVYGYINQLQGTSVAMNLLVIGSITLMFLISVMIAAKQILFKCN